ncbi:hypothetical protein [Nonomuraea sp. GTA35]|uniref:hypothetical protein n=1 Tax=Nonomuraea sp. GTA35 TaxID=1676746 RepID=UPI0035BF19FB
MSGGGVAELVEVEPGVLLEQDAGGGRFAEADVAAEAGQALVAALGLQLWGGAAGRHRCGLPMPSWA